MSKKHFKEFAETLKHARPDHPEALKTWKRITEDIARDCRQFNPRFDRERFLDACGYYEGGKS